MSAWRRRPRETMVACCIGGLVYPLGASGPRRIGVVGAGTMGSGIAQVAAAAGLDVRLYDVAEAALERGLTNVQTSLERFVRSGRLGQDGAAAALARIQSTL